MISGRPAVSPARALRARALGLPLLVMAVLFGLLAMHGLGATPPREGHPHGAAQHSSATAADGHGGTHAGGPARHGHNSPPLAESQHTAQADACECGGADGHVSHADATCSATGTSGAPSMDGPAASTAPGPQPASGLAGCRSRTGGERAPPSLHQLQLLRI
ncbi:DUF6153 family protein [Streptomyces abyssalis]|uniref:DUF6153 family protein n=1 Tax=Streptomyces abyssalis TaxID=933944 RepID=UPI001112F4DE|nr:DUF6153 family protein [Streptomyces abyssalis]